MEDMSSKEFQPVPGPDGNYRRLAQGWRRSRVNGHLWEYPVTTDGFKNITDTSRGVHVEDCPQCHVDATREDDRAAYIDELYDWSDGYRSTKPSPP